MSRFRFFTEIYRNSITGYTISAVSLFVDSVTSLVIVYNWNYWGIEYGAHTDPNVANIIFNNQVLKGNTWHISHRTSVLSVTQLLPSHNRLMMPWSICDTNIHLYHLADCSSMIKRGKIDKIDPCVGIIPRSVFFSFWKVKIYDTHLFERNISHT